MPVLLVYAKVVSTPRLGGFTSRLVLGYKRTILCHISGERTLRLHAGTDASKNFTGHVLSLRSDGDAELGIGRQFVAEVILGQRSFAMFRRPQDQGDVTGWRVLVGFDGFDMEPRGEMPEILTSETLERAVPVLFTTIGESLRSDGVGSLTELGDSLTPLVVRRPCDTGYHARLGDGPMLRQSFKEQFAGLLAPDFADVAAMLLCRSICHGPWWTNRQTQNGLPVTQQYLRRQPLPVP